MFVSVREDTQVLACLLKQVQMPNGTQALQLAGQNIQNLQGLQFLPLSALQVGSDSYLVVGK